MPIETITDLKTYILKPLDLAAKWISYSHIQLHPGIKNILHDVKPCKEFVGLVENISEVLKALRKPDLKAASKAWKIAEYLFKRKAPLFSTKPPELFWWAGSALQVTSSAKDLYTGIIEKNGHLRSILYKTAHLAFALLESPLIPRKSYQPIKLSLLTCITLYDIYAKLYPLKPIP
jgi:hypothetical protein